MGTGWKRSASGGVRRQLKMNRSHLKKQRKDKKKSKQPESDMM
jgi:hypothetical protein